MNSAKSQPISTQKNIKLGIVAGYFLIFGVLGIIVSLLLIFSLVLLVIFSILMIQTGKTILPITPILSVYFIIGFITIFYSAIIDFKIRKALINRELQGYQSALIYFVGGGIFGLLLSLISILQSGLRRNLIFQSIWLVLTIVLIYLLYSQKRAFNKYTIKTLNKYAILVLILSVLIYILGIIWQKDKSYKQLSEWTNQSANIKINENSSNRPNINLPKN